MTRFSIALGEGQQFASLARHAVAISPDGTHIAYVINTGMHLRSMTELEARVLPGTEIAQGVINPVFSPDSRSIAFYARVDRTIKRMAITGGAAIAICPAPLPFGMNWDADGILFGQGSGGVRRCPSNGGKQEVLLTVKPSEEAHGPQMLPDGRTVLFTIAASGSHLGRWDKAQIVAQALGSSERKTLIEGGFDGRYLPTGHIVYALGGVLFAVPFDPVRLQVTGGPTPIVEGVRVSTAAQTGAAHYGVATTGSLVYIPGRALASGDPTDLAVIDRKGFAQPLKLPPGSYQCPRVSPDGKRIAFGGDDGKEAMIWMYDLAGTSSMRRLTFGGSNRFPVWSADGQRVTYQSDREGDAGIFWQRAEGTSTAERLTKAEHGTAHVPSSWSPHGDWLLFSMVKGSDVSLWMLSLQDGKTRPFGAVESQGSFLSSAAFSPDGRWVAYVATDAGLPNVYVQPFPATGVRFQISRSGGIHPSWAPNGRELFYQTPGQNWVVSVTTHPTFATGNPVLIERGPRLESGPPVPRNTDMMPDGQRFVGVVAAGTGPSTMPLAQQVNVVLNWFEELRQRVRR